MGTKERALHAQKETEEMEKRGIILGHYDRTAMPVGPVKKKAGRPKKIVMESSSSESEEEKPKPKKKVR
jgi:hypothetical protein